MADPGCLERRGILLDQVTTILTIQTKQGAWFSFGRVAQPSGIARKTITRAVCRAGLRRDPFAAGIVVTLHHLDGCHHKVGGLFFYDLARWDRQLFRSVPPTNECNRAAAHVGFGS